MDLDHPDEHVALSHWTEFERGEFYKVAEEILMIAGEEGGLRSGHIEQIVGRGFPAMVNCYQGTPGASCTDLAFFVSLSASRLARGGGPSVMPSGPGEIHSAHAGSLRPSHKAAIIITEVCNAEAYQDWRSNAPVYLTDIPSSREHGSTWATDRGTLCLKVFSSVLPNADDSFNVLVNPAHLKIDQVRIVDIKAFEFDSRLF